MADARLRLSPTPRCRARHNTARMDEPTHARESYFWDQVADWILGAHALDHGPLTPDEIEALLREGDTRTEPKRQAPGL
jgi:hypothetical protein